MDNSKQGIFYSDYIETNSRQPRRHFKYMVLLAVIFGLLLTGLFIALMPKKGKVVQQMIISPLADPVGTQSTVVEELQNPKSALSSVVRNALLGTNGTYGIFIKHLKTGEEYMLDDRRVFEPASLYKLWVMATVFKQIEAGKFKKSDVLQADVENLNDRFDIASDAAELSEGSISMTVEQALEQMITISHNYAALLLASKVKNSEVSNFLNEYGFFDSKLGQPPQSTPYDIALFFEKLYKKELVSESVSEQMIEILKKQKLNDRIPKYLPETVDIAHKTGEINGYKHDAGIVFADTDYIFVVMSESDFPQGAAEREANLSRAVYEYFQGK